RDSLYSAFAIYTSSPNQPNGYARALAQYQDTLASTFLTNRAAQSGTTDAPPPVLPADAGRLSLSVGATLNAVGTGLSKAAKGGRAATIEVSATDIEVTDAVNSSAATSGAASGPVQLSASVLQSWNPGELVIGGVTRNGALNVVSNTVTVDSGANLTADQI